MFAFDKEELKKYANNYRDIETKYGEYCKSYRKLMTPYFESKKEKTCKIIDDINYPAEFKRISAELGTVSRITDTIRAEYDEKIKLLVRYTMFGNDFAKCDIPSIHIVYDIIFEQSVDGKTIDGEVSLTYIMSKTSRFLVINDCQVLFKVFRDIGINGFTFFNYYLKLHGTEAEKKCEQQFGGTFINSGYDSIDYYFRNYVAEYEYEVYPDRGEQYIASVEGATGKNRSTTIDVCNKNVLLVIIRLLTHLLSKL